MTQLQKPLNLPARTFLAAIFLLSQSFLCAQGSPGGIRGQITDPSGSAVPDATVTLSGGLIAIPTVKTDVQGQYQFRNLVPGVYSVRAQAKGFAPFQLVRCEAIAGRTVVADIHLALAANSEQVTVQDTLKLDVDPASNGGALVLRGKELDALSDDSDDLAADLQALAGPSAGPNGGQIYIDGFTGGKLPLKSAIREVRINQNPFSAQYDKLGYGRIEIFTKPGSEDLHGELQFQYGNDVFNSRNPFVPIRPHYERRQWEGEITAPLGKKTSIFADFEIRRLDENAFINAVTLDQNLQPVTVQQGVVTPRPSTEENVKLDHQLTPNHTLTARYTLARDSLTNQGVGGFSLAPRAYNSHDSEDDLQAVETGVFGSHTINETRVRYWRPRSRQNGNPSLPTTVVLDAFTGGGSPLQLSFTNQDRYEVQNNTSLTHGSHVLRWGGRLRAVSLNDQDTQNYTGTYTFSSLGAYRLTLLGLQQGLTAAQIRASGGGASQFSLAGGNPLASLNQVDVGVFAQDDWRLRPNVTLSLGFRYEGQTHLGDHRDVAPRVGLAWGLGTKGKAAKTVVRTGAGFFYDRVSESLTLDAIRRDGIHQQQFVVDAPDFYPTVPSPAQLAGNREPQAIRQVDAHMRAPRMIQTALAVERQLPKNIVATVTWLHTRGLHVLRSRDINAPLPASGIFPYGGVGAIYLYEASGIFKQDQLVASVNAKVSSRFSLSTAYTLNQAKSDSDGAGTFAADPYNERPEYGRAGFDLRHRLQLNGSFAAPWGLRLSPLLVATSGRPYNITLGRDVNGDTLFTDRPAFATDSNRASVVHTLYGVFDLQPLPGQTIIPRNYGAGPTQFAANLRLAKTVTIGEQKKGGGKGRDPYEITFSVQARNVLNHPNLGLPVGNLSSPLFGHSVAVAANSGGGAAGNRRIDLQVKFTF